MVGDPILLWFFFTLLLILLLLLLPVRIEVSAALQMRHTHVRVSVVLAGIRLKLPPFKRRKSKRRVPASTSPADKFPFKEHKPIGYEEILDKLHDVTEMIDILEDTLPRLKKAIRPLCVTYFTWESAVGLPNAAETATAVGGFWILKSGILGILSRMICFTNEITLEITPLYEQLTLESEITCIVGVTLGQAIVVVVRLVSLVKEGISRVRTSDSIPHANGNGKLKNHG